MLYSSLQLFWYEFISVLASASLDITPPLKDNIFLLTDISTLSVGFVQVLIVHLAYMLASKLTQSDGAVDELMSEYKML
jgi:hypothetical protein